MKEKYVCDLCGKTHYELDEYVKCVVECGEKLKKLEEEEKNKKYLEEVNKAIDDLNDMMDSYRDKLMEFKEKFPKEYELNFVNIVTGHDCYDCDLYFDCDNCCYCNDDFEDEDEDEEAEDCGCYCDSCVFLEECEECCDKCNECHGCDDEDNTEDSTEVNNEMFKNLLDFLLNC